MAEKVQIKAATRRTKTGKVVTVRAYNQNRDKVGEALKSEGRAPVAAQPGSFPNGRSTPGSPLVSKYEAERQDTELQMAQFRAKVAQDNLDRLINALKDETGTVEDKTSFTALTTQLDALIAAEQAAGGATGGEGPTHA